MASLLLIFGMTVADRELLRCEVSYADANVEAMLPSFPSSHYAVMNMAK